MRILLVEDDRTLGDGILAGLRQEGHVVDWATDGQVASHALATELFEAVVLDIALPRRSGLEVLADMRRGGDDTPVLVLTARDSTGDKIRGLDLGADDYMVKPFDLDELGARLRAIRRRRNGRASPMVEHGDLRLDPADRSVTWHGEPVPLSRREFALLQALLEARGRVLSREQLEDSLYGWGESVESNAVQVHIHHLRRKFGTDLIHTVRGVGYRIGRAGSH